MTQEYLAFFHFNDGTKENGSYIGIQRLRVSCSIFLNFKQRSIKVFENEAQLMPTHHRNDGRFTAADSTTNHHPEC
jgi:hypothetical protein